MLKVHDETREDNLETAGNAVRDDVPTLDLDALAREGARRMLMAAMEEEVVQYLDTHADARDENGRRQVVRNGHARSRTVTCGAGTMQVRAPRVNDGRVVFGVNYFGRLATIILAGSDQRGSRSITVVSVDRGAALVLSRRGWENAKSRRNNPA